MISDFPGVCVGFSIASALSFAKNASFYNQFPVMNNVDNLYELNLSGANGNEIRKVINHLGAINYIIPMPRETQSTSPREYFTIYCEFTIKGYEHNEKQFKMALGLANEKRW
ncbi:MAG: hypothetical protein IPG02_17290 [Ignavibacteria bacterium]|nr:hypothetical protein [Ignavibacteria bacterium]